eukprot:scaffold14.g1149.t1
MLQVPCPCPMDGSMSELILRLQEAAQLGCGSSDGAEGSSSSSGGGASPGGSSPRTAALAGCEHALARRCLWPDGMLSTLTPSSPGGGTSRRGSPWSSGRGTPQRASSSGVVFPTALGRPQAAHGCAAALGVAALPWRDLPADVMSLVVCHLALPDIKAARLACREWHRSISAHVRLLRPRALKARAAAKRFGALQALELKQCSRSLQDWDLDDIDLLRSLLSVSLEGCEAVTDDSCGHLARLPRLRHLRRGRLSPVALLRSPLLRSAGGLFAAPARGPHAPARRLALASLDVSGCILISERGFAALVATQAASLQDLVIGGCSRVSTVSDAVLAEVGRLSRLTRLDMSGCTQVSDAGLQHVGRLARLRSLCLWNVLRVTDGGLAALAGAAALTELSLRGCQQLTDACLAHAGALPELRRLDARACEHLRGEEFGRLRRLTQACGAGASRRQNSSARTAPGSGSLTELNLRGCYSVADPGLEALGAALRSLEVLNLQECWQVTERGLASLSGLTRLADLNLQGCRNIQNAPGQPLPGLGALAALRALCLRNCDRLADGALAPLSRLHGLSSLDLSGCKDLSPAGLAPLGGLRLAHLKLQHCLGLRGPAALAALSGPTVLTALHLGGCDNVSLTLLHALPSPRLLLPPQGCATLTDAGLAALGQLTALVALNLSDCTGLTGAGFAGWAASAPAGLTSLQLQNLSGLEDGVLAEVAKRCPRLAELNLKHCRRLTDASIAGAAPALRRLASLCLQGMTGLSDEALRCLAAVTSLRELELQFCWQLTDAGIAHLTALELSRLDLMYTWKVTDDSLAALSAMTSLLCLNVLGCHRLSPGAKAALADRLSPHAF